MSRVWRLLVHSEEAGRQHRFRAGALGVLTLVAMIGAGIIGWFESERRRAVRRFKGLDQEIRALENRRLLLLQSASRPSDTSPSTDAPDATQ